jgi:hypothetical protein
METESKDPGSGFRDALIQWLQENAELSSPKQKKHIRQMVLWPKGETRK